MKGKNMRKVKNNQSNDELRPEYDFDFSKAVTGKYYGTLLKERSIVIILEPDLAESFHDSVSVNKALRLLLKFKNSSIRLTGRSTKRTKPTIHSANP
jgi:hypothetical protein